MKALTTGVTFSWGDLRAAKSAIARRVLAQNLNDVRRKAGWKAGHAASLCA
jgi:hypothetical protein